MLNSQVHSSDDQPGPKILNSVPNQPARELGSEDSEQTESQRIEVPNELQEQLTNVQDCLDLLEEYRQFRPLVASVGELPWQLGQFEVIEELGRGGFGVVFRAKDPELGREVALKIPRPDCLWTPELRQRFLYEGRIAARLDHPNIVPVFQAGDCEGVCYLVAEYIPGVTLSQWLRDRTELLDYLDAARLVAALADAVEHAHSRGVLHRDLKPSNVLLDKEGSVPKITDFGLARLADGTQGPLTHTGLMLGTPAYMAPEQAAGDSRKIGTHTDIYALGVILYELLTGTRPFEGEDRAATLRLVLTAIPCSVRQCRPDVPRDLESICLKCLEKDPSQRYRTAQELTNDLRRFLSGEPTIARPPRLARRVLNWCRRHPATASSLAVISAGVMVLVAGIGWHIYQINRVNFALEAALEEGNNQRLLAVESELQARSLAYAGQVRVACGLWENGKSESLRELLGQCRLDPFQKIPLDFSWRYLWHQGSNDQRLRGHRGSISFIDFDGRGSLYTASTDGTIRIWDTNTGQTRGLLDGLSTEVPIEMAVSPDGLLVALQYQGKDCTPIQIWHMPTRRLLTTNPNEIVCERSMTFLPDNETLAIRRHPTKGEEPGALIFWNTRNGEKRILVPDCYQTTSIALSPDGRVVVAACEFKEFGQESAGILLTPSGDRIGQLPKVPGLITYLTISDDGKWVAGGTWRGSIFVWDFETRTVKLQMQVAGEDERINSLVFVEGGQGILVRIEKWQGPPGRLQLVDIGTGKDHSAMVESIVAPGQIKAVPKSDRLAMVSNFIHLRLFRLKPITNNLKIPAHQAEVWGIAYSSDGRTLVTSSDDHTAAVWDTQTWTRRHTLSGHKSLVSGLAISSDGNWVATGSFDNTIKIWDLKSGQLLRTFGNHTRQVRAIAVSPDGQYVASGDGVSQVWLWNLATGERVDASVFAKPSRVRTLAFTPDSKRLIVGGENLLVVMRELSSGLTQEYHHAAQVCASVLLPGGRELLTGGSDGVLQVRDLSTGGIRDFPGGHSGQVLSVAVSPDGLTAASAGNDGCVRLWHIATGLEICVFQTSDDIPRCVAFSPDGTTLTAGMHSGKITLWNAPLVPNR
jgi:eukaryotic-like serine/threonine-protein kinase